MFLKNDQYIHKRASGAHNPCTPLTYALLLSLYSLNNAHSQHGGGKIKHSNIYDLWFMIYDLHFGCKGTTKKRDTQEKKEKIRVSACVCQKKVVLRTSACLRHSPVATFASCGAYANKSIFRKGLCPLSSIPIRSS